MKFDDITKQSLLYDFYGALLTDKQREIMELYHEENYSIVEIASELKVSKQAVYDSLKKSESILSNYEDKLGLMRSLVNTRDTIEEIDSRIEELISLADDDGSAKLRDGLEEIRSLIRKLDE